MRRITSIFALGAILLSGCATPPAVSAVEEDSPAWDCWTMGNKVCGANPIERTEAWAKFDLDADKTVGGSGARVTYLGLALEGVFRAEDTVTIGSDVTPGKVHVFHVEVKP